MDEAREAVYRLLNDELTEQQRALYEDGRGLDTKAALLAGVASATVAYLLDHPGGLAWSCAMTAHGTSLGLALAVLWPKPWARMTPDVAPRAAGQRHAGDAVRYVVGSKVTACEANARRVHAAQTLWCTSVAALVVAQMLTVLTTLTEVVR
jgi:hypothetical protein